MSEKKPFSESLILFKVQVTTGNSLTSLTCLEIYAHVRLARGKGLPYLLHPWQDAHSKLLIAEKHIFYPESDIWRTPD